MIRILFSFCLLLSPFTFALQNSVEDADNHQRYVYQVKYKKVSIGKMVQEYHWQGNHVAVNSVADFSFLYFSFGGNQKSSIHWDELQKLFLTRNFYRQSVGFSVVDMSATFSEDGLHTQIVNNGDKSQYTNINAPVVDFNTITLQISEGLKMGQTEFEFYMQTSDDIAHYFFNVIGKETVHTQFGNFETFRVEQTRKSDRTFVAWFAPELHYKMVKFDYKRKVLDIHGELIEYTQSNE